MSPRAAWRLETLGFTDVYDYKPSKMDWLAFGLPSEGADADHLRAGPVSRKDVPRCLLDEKVGIAQERAHATGWEVCAVVNAEDVLLGAMRGSAWKADSEELVSNAMQSGPATIRPSEYLEKIAGRMAEHDVDTTFVTASDGTMVGVLFRGDAEAMLRS